MNDTTKLRELRPRHDPECASEKPPFGMEGVGLVWHDCDCGLDRLEAAEARVVELEGSVRRLVEEELPLLRVRRWRDMNVEDKNPMPFKKAESERTGHMVPDPLGGWVSAPMIQTKLMRLLETPND